MEPGCVMACGHKTSVVTRDDLRRRCLRVLRVGRGTRPEVRLLDVGGWRVVTKDYAVCPPGFRLLLGRWLAAKERRNYRRLAGLPGIASWVCEVDPYCFAIGYVEGTSCADIGPGQLDDPEFYRRLNALVRRLHEGGLVHCDLRYRSNIMVSPAGEPYLLDLVSAFPREGSFGVVRRWLFRLFSEADFQAIAKLKAELSPQLLTSADMRLLGRVWPIERLARAARAVVVAGLGLLVHKAPRRRPRRPRRFERYRQQARVQARQEELRLESRQ